ncbi:aromatic ring-hydroxylating dioxygenase subunit alpha [Phenylobacterium sp.]|jgi:phenylpropionate dioxygenase-like ring-hydroxylating dioxygenase large terminal subunit|uniref:aromatic ring-hydroxylating oxygenase subunit alpha n=1 Tax=Phenylobacterium sp. TaxID=1871053 RepID=UPI002E321B27|nr:aromatic ring-hydroxylating dioxygenase subunit alpha [Phenylobacterium sp.]HEX4710806.1 aromatic ring-hydroxylating dioxygenase subunit alpha [Phenylobacterium sp.]
MASPVLTDAFIESLESSVVELDRAETLPPACYTDAEIYAFEKEALFNHEWLCVGREDWVKEPGDYFTTQIIGEPIVVARARDGVVRAMSSVCQHRAMLVAEGKGNTRGFVCPYHHWVYGLDGKLVNAPAMDRTCDFDKKKVRLPEFKVETWLGFLFINFDPDAAPLAPRLTRVAEAVAGYDLANAESATIMTGQFAWNWKVMFENNNDGYHASKLHQGPLHDFVPSELAIFPEWSPQDAGFLRFNGTLHPDASFNPTQRAVLPVFPNLTELDRSRMTFANVPPTLSLVLTNDVAIYLILRATGPETMEQDTGILVAPGASEDPAFAHRLEMIMTSAGKIIAQDMHVDSLVQVGLRSRFAPRGRYSWQEGAQGQFNQWLVPRYRAAWNRMKSKAAAE